MVSNASPVLGHYETVVIRYSDAYPNSLFISETFPDTEAIRSLYNYDRCYCIVYTAGNPVPTYA